MLLAFPLFSAQDKDQLSPSGKVGHAREREDGAGSPSHLQAGHQVTAEEASKKGRWEKMVGANELSGFAKPRRYRTIFTPSTRQGGK